jgi:outer membrane biogenesis lipoprotein LolB
MKIKILTIYFLAFAMLFLCSCSEVADTTAKELRSGIWQQNGDNYTVSLEFKNDDAVLKIKDNRSNKERIFQGTTIVTQDNIQISDKETLSTYSFDYKLKGDKVKLTYNDKTISLMKK